MRSNWILSWPKDFINWVRPCVHTEWPVRLPGRVGESRCLDMCHRSFKSLGWEARLSPSKYELMHQVLTPALYLRKSFLCFQPLGPRDRTHVIRLGSRHIYLLNHLSGSIWKRDLLSYLSTAAFPLQEQRGFVGAETTWSAKLKYLLPLHKKFVESCFYYIRLFILNSSIPDGALGHREVNLFV